MCLLRSVFDRSDRNATFMMSPAVGAQVQRVRCEPDYYRHRRTDSWFEKEEDEEEEGWRGEGLLR